MSYSSKAANYVKGLLAGLPTRQKEILIGRHGLSGRPFLTLAELGEGYGITRERVRQIESFALAAIQPQFIAGELKKFIEAALSFLKKYGGVRKSEFLMEDLDCDPKNAAEASFLLEASGKCRSHKEDNDFYAYWYATADDQKRAVSFISRLKDCLRDKKEEIIEHKNFDRLFVQVIKPHNLQDAVAMNFVSISKAFNSNPFGDFGLSEWPEILPLNARDWAYLILKKAKKPMHFNELSEEISKMRDATSGKKTNPQTVHNELIKDERFVLVGRGTYGLKEFGILPGTAREVIAHFLKNNGPLKPRDLIKLVLEQRIFKENTLLLNLQNKRYFQRLNDGRYTLREA